MKTYNSLSKHLSMNQYSWLITGVSGFIGSNLLERLLELNQKVVGLDNFSTGKSENLDEVQATVSNEHWKNFNFIEGDICDIDLCNSVTEDIDFTLHQAALGSVPRSIEDPIKTNEINISGFLNILLAAKNNNVKNFVYAASSSTYGDHELLPKVEDQIGKPLSPYAVTKYVNEVYADVFKTNYDFNSVGLRYFNVFGKRQDPNGAYAAVIPKWIAAMIMDNDVYINGDGETTRDFCYIENVIQANLLAAAAGIINHDSVDRSDAGNEIYNIAVGGRTTLNELYKILKVNLSSHFPHLKDAEPIYRDFRKGDVLHSQANIAKARTKLGYDPSYNANEGLKEAMDWYIYNRK